MLSCAAWPASRLTLQPRGRLSAVSGTASRPQVSRRAPAVAVSAAGRRRNSEDGAGASAAHHRRHRLTLSSNDHGDSGDAGEQWAAEIPPLTSMDPAVMRPGDERLTSPAPAWRRSLNEWAARMQYWYL